MIIEKARVKVGGWFFKKSKTNMSNQEESLSTAVA
jgi:hypothetical protein